MSLCLLLLPAENRKFTSKRTACLLLLPHLTAEQSIALIADLFGKPRLEHALQNYEWRHAKNKALPQSAKRILHLLLATLSDDETLILSDIGDGLSSNQQGPIYALIESLSESGRKVTLISDSLDALQHISPMSICYFDKSAQGTCWHKQYPTSFKDTARIRMIMRNEQSSKTLLGALKKSTSFFYKVSLTDVATIECCLYKKIYISQLLNLAGDGLIQIENLPAKLEHLPAGWLNDDTAGETIKLNDVIAPCLTPPRLNYRSKKRAITTLIQSEWRRLRQIIAGPQIVILVSILIVQWIAAFLTSQLMPTQGLLVAVLMSSFSPLVFTTDALIVWKGGWLDEYDKTPCSRRLLFCSLLAAHIPVSLLCGWVMFLWPLHSDQVAWQTFLVWPVAHLLGFFTAVLVIAFTVYSRSLTICLWLIMPFVFGLVPLQVIFPLICILAIVLGIVSTVQFEKL